MGIYLKAEGSPDIDSSNYIGTYGNSQSLPILTMIGHYEKMILQDYVPEVLDMLPAETKANLLYLKETVQEINRDKVKKFHETGRVTYDVGFFGIIDRDAPKDAVHFREFATMRGVTEWMDHKKYDDDHVQGVRDVITKIAEHGQNVYET